MDHFREVGRIYGYPECCIDAFISDVKSGQFLVRPERKLTGTGFVPCAVCNENHSVDELVAIINSRRTHPTPFKGPLREPS